MEHEKSWDVRFLEWNKFTQALISRQGFAWDLLVKAHLVIGGVNFTSRFL
jgi:hypothetical protein